MIPRYVGDLDDPLRLDLEAHVVNTVEFQVTIPQFEALRDLLRGTIAGALDPRNPLDQLQGVVESIELSRSRLR